VRDFIAALDAATGKLLWRKYVVPRPASPAATWKDQNNAGRTEGRRNVGDRHLRWRQATGDLGQGNRR